MMGLAKRDIAALYEGRYAGFRQALAAITGSDESARDVVQEAFAQALRHRRSFRGEGSPEAWIWKIAVRIAFRERASRSREPVGLDGPGPSVDMGPTEPIRDPLVAVALRALPARRRLIVFLHYFGDLSYEQIGEICEVSPGTVGATLTKARESVRAALTAKDEVTT
jgi:RNA polymerase sigma-70 factor (ECF subfamily)